MDRSGAVPGAVIPYPTGPQAPLPWDWKRGGLLNRQSWEPSGEAGTVQVHNVIHMDGAAIARAVHDYVAADLMHPRQAPYFNGREESQGRG